MTMNRRLIVAEIRVAPTEPPSLRAVGAVGLEEYGCDVTVRGTHAVIGIQRKSMQDLVASIGDGRLQRDIMGARVGMMARELDVAVLLVEGDVRDLSSFGPQWTESSLRKLLWGVRGRGVWVERTGRLSETVEVVSWFAEWADRPSGGTLATMPKSWRGVHVDVKREWGEWVLQVLPGVGVKLARRIYDQLGVPLRWEVGKEELMEVEGIGEKKAEKILGVFDG